MGCKDLNKVINHLQFLRAILIKVMTKSAEDYFSIFLDNEDLV